MLKFILVNKNFYCYGWYENAEYHIGTHRSSISRHTLDGPVGTSAETLGTTRLISTWNKITWWRHQMEIICALLSLCAGNSPGTGEFSSQRPVTRNFDVSFDLRPNKWLSKQPRCRWFETPSRSLWRHCSDLLPKIPSSRRRVCILIWPANVITLLARALNGANIMILDTPC